MSKYKIGDMYAPKAIFMAVAQMVAGDDPIRRIYDDLRKNPLDFNAPRKILLVSSNRDYVYLEGISGRIHFEIMDKLFNPVWIKQECESEVTQNDYVAPRENTSVVLDKFFKVAHQVKKRTKSDVVHHLAAEVGEISECLIQPQRGGNIVEESVDAIVCALDVINLELGTTHGTAEIAQVINKILDKKLDKWYDTCKPE